MSAAHFLPLHRALCVHRVQALELPHPAEPIRGLIKALFDQCEKDKPKVQPNEAADREYCKNFALTVFSRADKLDRARRADINTAKCYYAAAIFLQVSQSAYRQLLCASEPVRGSSSRCQGGRSKQKRGRVFLLSMGSCDTHKGVERGQGSGPQDLHLPFQ